MKLLLLCAVMGAALAMPVEKPTDPASAGTPEKIKEPALADAVPKLGKEPKSEIESKPEAAKVEPVAEPKIEVPEVKTDAFAPEVKPVEALNIVPQAELVNTDKEVKPELKSSPIEEPKSAGPELVPNAEKLDAAAIEEEQKPIAEVKREAVPEVAKTEKKEEEKATVVEVPKQEAKSELEKVDVVKAANENAGIAADIANPAAIIPQPEKKIDIPVKPEEELKAAGEPKNEDEDKKPEASPKPQSATPEMPIEKSADLEVPKSSEPIVKELTPVPTKPAESSEDSLRVIRDTIDDQLKAQKAAEDNVAQKKNAEKSEEKPDAIPEKPSESAAIPAGDNSAAPVLSEAPKTNESPKAEELPKALDLAKSEDIAKAPETPEAPETPKEPEQPNAPEAQKAPETPKDLETPKGTKGTEAVKSAEVPKVNESNMQEIEKPVQNDAPKPSKPSSQESAESSAEKEDSDDESSSEEKKPAKSA